MEARPVVTIRGAVGFGVWTAIMFGVGLLVARGDNAPFAYAWMTLLALTFALQLARGLRASARPKAARLEQLRAADALPDVTGGVADVADGAQVRVEGVVRVVRPAAAPDGARCAAWQLTERLASLEAEGSEEGPAVTVGPRGGGPGARFSLFDGTEARSSGGGVFALELASGERVTVRAEHVVLAEDGHVVDGDRVVVAGTLRRTVTDDAAAHLRADPRVVELVGTEHGPLVIRRLSRDARTGVRVEEPERILEEREVSRDERAVAKANDRR